MRIVRLLMVIVALSALTSVGCSSQKELTPEQVAQNRADSLANVAAVKMLQKQAFAFTADQVIGTRGQVAQVTSNTNFIIVEGKQATIQISPRIGAGPNGVGGVTFKGDVSGYTVSSKPGKDTTVRFHFTSSYGSGDVSLTLYKKSLRANAYINATFTRGKAQMMGTVSPLGSERIVEGISR